jgi:DNA-binding NtrC family response regulator
MRDKASITAVHELPKAASSRPSNPRLLWVDDCQPLLGLYNAIFADLGFEVRMASSPREALDDLAAHAIDVVILDYEMPEMNGCELARLVKDRYPGLPVILYSASSEIPQNARCWVDAVCYKTAPREHLLALIEANLEHGDSQRASQQMLEDEVTELACRRMPQRDSIGIVSHEFRTPYRA